MKKRVALIVTAVAVAATAFAWRAAKSEGADRGERIDAATLAHLKRFSEVVERSRASAVAAFSANGGTEHDALDREALADIERLGEFFKQIRDEMPAAAAGLANEIVDRYNAAQLQLMSFAINRKNREIDGQTDMEKADGAAFSRDSASLRDRLSGAIASRSL